MNKFIPKGLLILALSTSLVFASDTDLTPEIRVGNILKKAQLQNNKGYKDLLCNLDLPIWRTVFSSHKLGKANALSVFTLLGKVKESLTEQMLVSDINQAMLSLLAGKWGFSPRQMSSSEKNNLKNNLTQIGKDLALEDSPSIFKNLIWTNRFVSRKNIPEKSLAQHQKNVLQFLGYERNPRAILINSYIASLSNEISDQDFKALRAFCLNPSLPLLEQKKEDKIVQQLNALLIRNSNFIDILKKGYLQNLLTVSTQYNVSTPLEGIYPVAIEHAFKQQKQKKRTITEINQGAALFLYQYFKELVNLSYSKEMVSYVSYGGPIENRYYESNTVISRDLMLKAIRHREHYSVLNFVKNEVYPNLNTGEKVIFEVNNIKESFLSVIDEDSGLVKQQMRISPNWISRYQNVIDMVNFAFIFKQDPNIEPPICSEKYVPSDLPLKVKYAINGGIGISQKNALEAHSNAIDALIQEKVIVRELKLSSLLFFNEMFDVTSL